MLHDGEHGCGGIGRWVAVLCAAVGAGMAGLMLYVMDIGHFLFPAGLPKEIVVGLVVLFITAAVLGKKAGIHLCDKTHRTWRNVLVGMGVAFGSIAIAVLAGTFVGFLGEADTILRAPNFSVVNVVLGFFIPLLLVLWFGGIPAILLGVFYGFMIRNRLRKLNLT
jgi:hypothetical protein